MRKALLRRRRDARDHPLVRDYLSDHIGKPLTWDIESHGRTATVVMAGELDVGTMPGLEGELGPLASAGSHLILDLAGVRFCDCAGLNLFLRLQRCARAAGGSLHLVTPTASVRRLIAVTKLSEVLPVAGCPAEVIASLDGVRAAAPPPRCPDDDLGGGQQPGGYAVTSPARVPMPPVPAG